MPASKPVDPVAVLIDLVRAETRLYNRLDAALRERHGVTLGQWQFLDLIRQRGPLRVQDLADEVDITIGATSKAVDRMVAADLVRRRAHPGDGRSQLISLTSKGERTLATSSPTLQDGAAEQLAALSVGSQAGLARGLADLSASMAPAT